MGVYNDCKQSVMQMSCQLTQYGKENVNLINMKISGTKLNPQRIRYKTLSKEDHYQFV